MIPKAIQHRIEYQFGKKIRYPKDCFALANEIAKVCNEHISPATLMRLFGLTKNNSHPRLFTLDVIAQYCGFSTWEEFLEKVEFDCSDQNMYIPQKEMLPELIQEEVTIKYPSKKMMITIFDENQLEVCDSEISQITFRNLVDPLIVKNAYLFILDSLDKNATGRLIKVDSAKLYPM